MATDVKAHARRMLEEVWSQGNTALIDELVSPKFTGHIANVPFELRGLAAYRQFVGAYRTAFPDLRFKVEDQIAEGESVLTRWTATGTQTGELMGLPATGKKAVVTGLSFARVSGGKVVEEWGEWDAMGMMRQLGFIPPLAGA